MGYHFEDEYKGCLNHLIYNCETGHLPPLDDVERELKYLWDIHKIMGDFEYIMKMKERGIFWICFSLAQVRLYICSIIE
jgi:hypothetical protein